MTTKSELESLKDQINTALANRGATFRVELRGAYGKVGLDKSINGNCGSHITGLMTRKELAAYMRAALDGLWMFN